MSDFDPKLKMNQVAFERFLKWIEIKRKGKNTSLSLSGPKANPLGPIPPFPLAHSDWLAPLPLSHVGPSRAGPLHPEA